MENYLNILHYCFYKAHYKLHLLFNKINPANLIHKLPFQKRRYEKLGINIQEVIDKTFSDKTFGISMTVAGGILFGVISIFFFSIILIFNLFVSIVYIIGCAVMSGFVCYLFVFRNDKYIKYFDEYEKWPEGERCKYIGLTLASVILLFFLFYLGLVF